MRFGWADRAVLVIRLYNNGEIAWPRSIGRARDVRSWRGKTVPRRKDTEKRIIKDNFERERREKN